jgi:tight adherence protein C
MRVTAAILLGCGVAAALGTRKRRWIADSVGAGVFVLVTVPLLGLAAAVSGAAMGVARLLRKRRLAAEAAEDDVVLLADLLALGLGAGLGLPLAFEEAGGELVPGLADEVTRVRRAMDRLGVSVALATAEGRAERLYHITGRAAATGASLVSAVEAFASERRHAEHMRRLEIARRLPVRLLVPLALLILPGFVVLAVGPALLESLARLDF